MGLPTITHLQVVILSTLASGDRPGKDVRNALAKSGLTISLPSFYQLTARMEKDKLIVGSYQMVPGSVKTLRERLYGLAPEGSKALQQTYRFYDAIRTVEATAKTRPRFSTAEGSARLN